MNQQPRPDRRGFLSTIGAAAAVSALGRAAVQPVGAVEPGVGIARLRLKTAKLEEMRRFYADTLGLKVRDGEGGAIAVQAGTTEIVFEPTEDKGGAGPFYHVAFNIPENKLAAAKEWLRGRCAIVTRADGSDEYHFAAWNAHAIYFLDPAGNIMEFIARHNLKNAGTGPFGVDDILYASEIALVVDDVRASARAAEEDLGMEPFAGSLSDGFAAVGDDHRLLIIAKRGRPWLGGMGSTAQVFPTGAVLRGTRAGKLGVGDLPYEIGPA